MFSLAFLTNVYNWSYQLNNDLNEPPTWGKMFLFHLSLFIYLKGAISSFSWKTFKHSQGTESIS